MRKKKALIFGISGQDGAYLSHFLLSKKYDVIGTTRNKSKKNLFRLHKLQIKHKIKILKGEATGNESLKSFYGKDLARAHFYAGIRFSILGNNKMALSHFKKADDIGWQYHIESGSFLPEMIMARGEIRRLSGDSWLLRFADGKISERSSDEELLMEQVREEDSLTARALLANIRFEITIFYVFKHT